MGVVRWHIGGRHEWHPYIYVTPDGVAMPVSLTVDIMVVVGTDGTDKH